MKRGEEYDVLCRQICVDKTTYAFIPHNHIKRGLRPDLLIGLVLFVDNQETVKYLFPSTVWQKPDLLFTNTPLSHAEYGISVNRVLLAWVCARHFVRPAILLLCVNSHSKDRSTQSPESAAFG